MSPVEFLLIPPIAFVGALLWTAWSGRTRRPAQPYEQVEEYRRRMAALAPEPGRSADR